MKVMIGQIDPDEGSCDMPRDTRLGYIAQEAPSGTATPFDTVLAADRERAELMAEAEHRSEEHTSELQSLMRISYAVFCLKKKNTNITVLQVRGDSQTKAARHEHKT